MEEALAHSQLGDLVRPHNGALESNERKDPASEHRTGLRSFAAEVVARSTRHRPGHSTHGQAATDVVWQRSTASHANTPAIQGVLLEVRVNAGKGNQHGRHFMTAESHEIPGGYWAELKKSSICPPGACTYLGAPAFATSRMGPSRPEGRTCTSSRFCGWNRSPYSLVTPA
jgi:hypothetical protein